MSYSYEFHDLVSEDYEEAYIHYERIQSKLGERFASSIRKKMDEIAENPEHYGEKTKKGYRQAKVDTFPYVIVFKIYKQKKVVFVNSIHHTKKHPAKKFRK